MWWLARRGPLRGVEGPLKGLQGWVLPPLLSLLLIPGHHSSLRQVPPSCATYLSIIILSLMFCQVNTKYGPVQGVLTQVCLNLITITNHLVNLKVAINKGTLFSHLKIYLYHHHHHHPQSPSPITAFISHLKIYLFHQHHHHVN